MDVRAAYGGPHIFFVWLCDRFSVFAVWAVVILSEK